MKAGENKDLLCTSHQQGMSRHFWGSQSSVCVVVGQEDKCHNN